MGTGRGGGEDVAGLGLRLSARRADRPRHDRAAVARRVGTGRLRTPPHNSDLITDPRSQILLADLDQVRAVRPQHLRGITAAATTVAIAVTVAIKGRAAIAITGRDAI